MSNLTNEQLEKLPTPRLLALYKKNQKHIGYIGFQYRGGEMTKEDYDAEMVQHDFIKTLLNNREHVASK